MPADPQVPVMRQARLVLPYLVVAAFALWCAIALRADLAKLSFASVWTALDVVLVVAALSLLNYLLRALRWALYLRRLGAALPLGFVTLTYFAGFAFTLSPAKLGELVRARYYPGLPLASSAAAYFVERVLDLVVVIFLALVTYSASSRYSTLLWFTVAVVGAALVLLALLPWVWLQARVERLRLPALVRRVATPLLQALVAARALLRPDVLLLGFALGLVAWAAEGTGLGLLGALAPSVPMDWATGTGIYSIAIIVGALSFLPGGLGTTEAAMVVLLTAHGYPTSDALLITLVCRLLTLWLAVALGWLAVLALRGSDQKR